MPYDQGSAAARSPVLEMDKVSLAFGGVSVLNRISLSVGQSEVLALIGPNGAGKSALLNCVSGVYRPQEGARIEVGGIRIDHLPPHKIARVGVRRTFQGLNLIPDRSVLDNSLLGWTPLFSLNVFSMLARPLRARREEREARERASEIIALCGLEHLADRRCADLPLGILRRVDLARALVSDPKLLLLDEPASGLSHDERPIIGEMVRLALSRKNLSVLWIEHDLDLVFSEAQRAVVLHHGDLIDVGDPRISADRARLISSYKAGRKATASAIAA
jgi:branched-chain amino acid transport system ATP-binding protein